MAATCQNNDRIVGIESGDMLTGNNGSDALAYASYKDGNGIITDFELNDIINVSQYILTESLQ